MRGKSLQRFATLSLSLFVSSSHSAGLSMLPSNYASPLNASASQASSVTRRTNAPRGGAKMKILCAGDTSTRRLP